LKNLGRPEYDYTINLLFLFIIKKRIKQEYVMQYVIKRLVLFSQAHRQKRFGKRTAWVIAHHAPLATTATF
jgi:hypothetical protein